MRETKFKYALYVCGSMLVSLLPPGLIYVLNWGSYTDSSPWLTVRLCMGLAVLVVLKLLKVTGEVRSVRSITVFAVVWVASYLLLPSAEDMFIISSMALVGEVADWALFQSGLKKYKEQLIRQRESTAAGEDKQIDTDSGDRQNE